MNSSLMKDCLNEARPFNNRQILFSDRTSKPLSHHTHCTCSRLGEMDQHEMFTFTSWSYQSDVFDRMYHFSL